MTTPKLCAALAAATVALALGSGAEAADPPGKGVGALGCVRPVVPGTRWTGPVLNAVTGCYVQSARFRTGWCARTVTDKGARPWDGPASTALLARERAFADQIRGCWSQ